MKISEFIRRLQVLREQEGDEIDVAVRYGETEEGDVLFEQADTDVCDVVSRDACGRDCWRTPLENETTTCRIVVIYGY